MPASRLYDLADELLDAVAMMLEPTTPERRFVSPGPPALDCCAQLTVHPGAISKLSGDFAASMQPYTQVTDVSSNSWPLVVTLTRCTVNPADDGTPPAAASLDTVAALVLQDGWVLWNGVQDLIRSGQLFASLGCKATGIGPLLPLGEQGGCVGWTLTIPVLVDGEAL